MREFLLGVLIGLIFGVPAGAVGVMTVQRTFGFGLGAGLLTGLGSSAADCFYASAGVFGLSFISDFMLGHQTAINIVGSGLLLVMGIRLLLCKDENSIHKTQSSGLAKMFLSSFAVGITNPAAILTFIFALSFFGISENSGFLSGVFIVLGVLAGTFIWWLALTLAALQIKKRAAAFHFRYLNRIFGVVLCVFGAVVFFRQVM